MNHETGDYQKISSEQWLEKLVRLDTTSHKSNMMLIEMVSDYLSSLGIDVHIVESAEGNEKKANLYATIGPQELAGAMLSGHTDVVPVTGQDWASDPFTLFKKEGKFYGRGTCDMKGFIASVLSLVPLMLSSPLKRPIHLAFSYDEEVGCLGVQKLVDALEEFPVKPAMAIIGEPSSMNVVIGHKGRMAFKIDVIGASAHSAYTTEGVNALEYGVKLIHKLLDLQNVIQNEGPFDHDFKVPYTTIHCGEMKSGTALNIIPSLCSFSFEIRKLPHHDINPILDEFHDYIKLLDAEMKQTFSCSEIRMSSLPGYPSLMTALDHEIVRFVKSLLNQNETEVEKVSYGTEAGVFSKRLGIPSVVCGPGSILQAHKPNEFLSHQQLKACDEFLTRLIQQLSVPEIDSIFSRFG